MSVETRQRMTANDLLEMPEVPGKRYELVDGDLVEMPGASILHNFIVMAILRALDAFVHQTNLGIVFVDGLSYVLREDPALVRIPDVSFVTGHRSLPGDLASFFPGAPDLAIEVVSPSDRAEDIRQKVFDYLDAGSRLVWVVWPSSRSVSVYTPDRVSHELQEHQTLDGGDVLPGFEIQVGDLFPQTSAQRRQAEAQGNTASASAKE